MLLPSGVSLRGGPPRRLLKDAAAATRGPPGVAGGGAVARRRADREQERESCALAQALREALQAAAARAREFLPYREAQARPLEFPIARGIQLREGLEQLGDFRGVDPDALVGDFEAEPPLRRLLAAILPERDKVSPSVI